MINKVILIGKISNLDTKPWNNGFVSNYKFTVTTTNSFSGKDTKTTVKCSAFTKTAPVVDENATYHIEGRIAVNSVARGKATIDYVYVSVDTFEKLLI